ncbi:MAG: hypothetical protein ACRYFS_19995 [Janthinobacterium lividum]
MKERKPDVSESADHSWPPPPVCTVGDERLTSTRSRIPTGLTIGLALNFLILLFDTNLLVAQKGASVNIEPFVVPTFLVYIIGIIVGLPLSVRDFLSGKKRWSSTILLLTALLLNLTPYFLDDFLVYSTVKAKGLKNANSCCSQQSAIVVPIKRHHEQCRRFSASPPTSATPFPTATTAATS